MVALFPILPLSLLGRGAGVRVLRTKPAPA